jgi:hypothetical protein
MDGPLDSAAARRATYGRLYYLPRTAAAADGMAISVHSDVSCSAARPRSADRAYIIHLDSASAVRSPLTGLDRAACPRLSSCTRSPLTGMDLSPRLSSCMRSPLTGVRIIPPRLLRFDSRRFGPSTETSTGSRPPRFVSSCCVFERSDAGYRLLASPREATLLTPASAGSDFCVGDDRACARSTPCTALRSATVSRGWAPYSRHPAAAVSYESSASRGLSGYTTHQFITAIGIDSP